MHQTKNETNYDVVVVGGGAAGYFAALSLCELSDAPLKVLILEAQKSCLAKVKISGGGRCNITHNLMDPKELIKGYPRGRKEMLGPFYHWGPQQMLDWFQKHGLDHKIEADGRIFPLKNTSQAVIDCFESLALKYGIEVETRQMVESIERREARFWLQTPTRSIGTKKLLLATGGSRAGHKLAEGLGHSLTSTFPSIFTFKVADKNLHALSGLSLQDVSVELRAGPKSFTARGPLLVTHWGLSGPSVLKVSAFAAGELAAIKYRSLFALDFFPDQSKEELFTRLEVIARKNPKKKVATTPFEPIPKRFWQYLVQNQALDSAFWNDEWNKLSEKQLLEFAGRLKKFELHLAGRAVYKDEFVTGGGVENKGVDFRTMQSKLVEGLYFSGEILNVDGITGGFNFQNAWTTGRLCGQHLAKVLEPICS